MPFEAIDTSKPDLQSYESSGGLDESMRKVHQSAKRLQASANEFETHVNDLKQSKLYQNMKALQNSIINK